MSCADCDESPDLCSVCRKGICAVHRIGTGDLVMGYACSMTCSMSAWGPTYQKKRLRAFVSIFDRFGYVNVLAFVFIVLWSLVGLLHLIFG